MKPWTTIGEVVSPDGTRLELVEHDGEFVIKADNRPLMGTRMHFSAVKRSRFVCEGAECDTFTSFPSGKGYLFCICSSSDSG